MNTSNEKKLTLSITVIVQQKPCKTQELKNYAAAATSKLNPILVLNASA